MNAVLLCHWSRVFAIVLLSQGYNDQISCLTSGSKIPNRVTRFKHNAPARPIDDPILLSCTMTNTQLYMTLRCGFTLWAVQEGAVRLALRLTRFKIEKSLKPVESSRRRAPSWSNGTKCTYQAWRLRIPPMSMFRLTIRCLIRFIRQYRPVATGSRESVSEVTGGILVLGSR
jgi:hypothetical protein